MLPLGAAWSLFVEEVFYIISVVWIKFAPHWGVPTNNFFIYRSPFAKFQYFFLGFILYDIHNHHDTRIKILKNNKGYILTLLDIVTILSFICIFLETYILVELPVFLLVLTVITPNTFLSRISNIHILKWAGVRCYFIYIVHGLAIPFFGSHVISLDNFQTFSTDLKVTIFFILTLTTTTALAALSFKIFERSLINLGERLIQRRENRSNT